MLFLTFLVGLAVNFVGYIPFGNVNLTVVQLTINRGLKGALYFILSFSVIEFFFTYGIMYFVDWFALQTKFIYWLDWILVFVFILMGIASWLNTQKEKQVDYSPKDSIKHGIILGFLNPVQIPFWVIAGTYLIANSWITSGNGALAIFSLGSACGAFICLLSFAYFSKYLHQKFTFSSKVVNRGIAVVFFLLAAYQLIKMILLLIKG